MDGDLELMKGIRCPRCGAREWQRHAADLHGQWPVACHALTCEGVVAQVVQASDGLLVMFRLYGEGVR